MWRCALLLLAAGCSEGLTVLPPYDLSASADGGGGGADLAGVDLARLACMFPSDCPPGWACATTTGSAAKSCQCTASTETCDGKDNDCNGLVDDGMVCGPFGNCAAATCVACAPSTAHKAQFVIKQVTLPMDRQQFSIDLNGDGKVDNQFGNIIGALAAQNLDPSPTVQAAVAGGQALMLLEAHSADAAFTTDACGGVVFEDAQPKVPPDFSGAGSFTVDTTIAPGNLLGAYMQGFYNSDAPSTTLFPANITVELALFGPTPIKLPLVGAHVQFVQSSTGLANGQINGAVRQSDAMTILIPAWAAGLNATIAANPTDPTSKQWLQIFDTNMDGTVSNDEVANNSIVKNILAPDVQMFNGSMYQPNPQNTMKDSLSIGFGFTAVKATF